MRMEGLEILDLDRNKISEFPSLTHLPNLRLFSYDHNPTEGPPKVGEEVFLVGEGAAEELEARERRIERRMQRQKEREEEEEAAAAAAAAVAAEEPAIHGILKNAGSAPGSKGTNGSCVPNGHPTTDGGGGEGRDGEVGVEFGEGELEYEEEELEYEREEIICEGEGFDYERAGFEYDRAGFDYEYEEEEEERPQVLRRGT